jgi:hypothetical protein
MQKICLHCFEPEEDCHDHKFIEFPAKCLCDKGEWLCFAKSDVKITAICSKYTGSGGNCNNCEHDEACHE